jgi:carbon starvation protein
MDALAMVLAAGACLLAAYLTLGRWLARRVFLLDDDRDTPATALEDGRDYVPTKRSIIFGHHFTSIAGTGPIVGPAIAVMWGWLPALLWVIGGAIFIGAVHDLGSIVVSLRNKGRSIGDIAGDLLGPRARFVFLAILIVGLWIVLAIFGLVIAAVLRQYPASVTPVLAQIPLAIVIGVVIHRKGAGILVPSAVALGLMYLSVVLGDWGPLHAFNTTLASAPIWAWVVGLLAYAYVASVLPVWTLLQPRDYINALQLITTLGLIVVGLVVAALIGGDPNAHAHGLQSVGLSADAPLERPELSIVAPIIDWQPTGAPPLFPVLFITIACGACSGFHCLVGSGTTSKQISRETHAKAVGYGSMLTEGFLATLVIAACAAGIGLTASGAFEDRYASWQAAGSLAAKVGAFVEGSANLVASLGVPLQIAVALMAVMVASFAATTMDTACRLQRYVVQELSRTFLPRPAGLACPGCGYDLGGPGTEAQRHRGRERKRGRGIARGLAGDLPRVRHGARPVFTLCLCASVPSCLRQPLQSVQVPRHHPRRHAVRRRHGRAARGDPARGRRLVARQRREGRADPLAALRRHQPAARRVCVRRDHRVAHRHRAPVAVRRGPGRDHAGDPRGRDDLAGVHRQRVQPVVARAGELAAGVDRRRDARAGGVAADRDLRPLAPEPPAPATHRRLQAPRVSVGGSGANDPIIAPPSQRVICGRPCSSLLLAPRGRGQGEGHKHRERSERPQTQVPRAPGVNRTGARPSPPGFRRGLGWQRDGAAHARTIGSGL